MTYREIERLLADYFRSAGQNPTDAHGHLYIGTCSTCLLEPSEEEKAKAEARGKVAVHIVIPPGSKKAIASLTELAKLLEREMGR